MKEKIIEILYNELDDIYCNTCRFNTLDENIWKQEGYLDDPCDNCYRKNMKWEISKNYAEEIAKKIIKVIK